MRLWQDVRYGLRIFQRAPGFTAVAVFTLALGIGANTAIFSIVQAVLLRPLPYKDSERLVAIWDTALQDKGVSKLFDAYRDLEIYRQHSHSFEQAAGATWARGDSVMTGRGPAQNVFAIPATADFFSLLGVRPVLGRTFTKDDLNLGCAVVLANGFWQRKLGGPASIVGQTLRLDDQACVVTGVMPAGFDFYPTGATAMWKLVTRADPMAKDPDHSNIGIFARLKPGETIEKAQAELRLLHRQYHQGDRHSVETGPVVYPLQAEFTWLAGRNLRLSLLVLLAAVGAVLLIACVNVANLLLGRSLARQKELAIRAALGSARGRLIQQLLTEALLLSISAAALGTFLSFAAIQWFRAANPIQMPPANRVELNVGVLAFTATLSILATVLCGLGPAWRASCIDLHEMLKAHGRAAAQGRSRYAVGKGLIVAEVTLSLVLLVGAGLMIESVARFASAPLGFPPERLLTITIDLPHKTYATNEKRARFLKQVAESLRAISNAQSVALTSALPVRGNYGFAVLEVKGRATPVLESAPHDVAGASVSPDYFDVVKLPLQKGRLFDTKDQEQTEPVAIVNEALVKKYFANEDPIGQHIRYFGAQDPWLTIVGVIANEKRSTVYQEMSWVETPTVYRPNTQQAPSTPHLLIRTMASDIRLGDIVQKLVSGIDPSVPVGDVRTMQQILDKEFLAYPRFRALLLGGFAALALLLAAVGLYGVLAQLVAQRTQEIGVRMALGARSTDVLAALLKEGMQLVVVGVVFGLGASWLLTRFLAALLYGVEAMDPLILAGVSGVLIFASLLATYIPARRAAKVDPMVALRYE